MAQRVGIVTTLRNADKVLASFLDHHLSIGFEHVFLFFDDPGDPAIALAEQYRDVTVIRHDDALRRLWESTPLFKDASVAGNVDAEVMARQVLNAQVAVSLALERNFDWLLHIDSDELFHSFDRGVGDYFQSITDDGAWCMSFPNHEAIPERADIDDYFRDVTLFKRNLRTRRDPQLKPWHVELMRSVPQLPRQFFFFYNNGKSAARVSEDLLVHSVHGFRHAGGREPARAARNPVILHYPCCGFEHFWSKYRTLGNFGDKWFGVMPIADAIGPFHTNSRDVVMGGDREAARRFYEERVVLPPGPQVNRLLDSELLLRITEPAERLRSGDFSRLRRGSG